MLRPVVFFSLAFLVGSVATGMPYGPDREVLVKLWTLLFLFGVRDMDDAIHVLASWTTRLFYRLRGREDRPVNF